MEDFEKRENDNVVPLGAPEGQNNNPPAPANEVAPAAEAQATVYRWNYDESAAFEASKTKKKASRGAVIYAVVVSIAFILSFAALVFTLLFDFALDGSEPTTQGGSVTDTVVRVEERVVYVREADSQSGVLTTQEIYNKCLPSTVSILVADDTNSGTGSGFFISDDGYIATANHVIDGKKTIKVVLSNGEMYDAKVIDGNDYTDIAVIKIERTSCPAIAIGNSSSLLVGDDIVAIGTPAAADFAGSMVKGSVSYTNRMLKVYDEYGTSVEKKMRLIQTDTLVNPGNSGCPLINERGEAVGIVIRRLNATYYDGIGFAIPIDAAMPIIKAMINGENYDALLGEVSVKPAVVGISGENVKITDGDVYGVKVTAFSSESYDAASKLAIGDVITKMDGVAVSTMTELKLLLDRKIPGESIALTVYRAGEYLTVSVKLGS